MKTIKELRNELVEVFEDLKRDTIDLNRASEMNNTAGKTINTIRVQLEYHKLRKTKPEIDFLKCK